MVAKVKVILVYGQKGGIFGDKMVAIRFELTFRIFQIQIPAVRICSFSI